MDPSLKENFITTKEAGEISGYSSDYLSRLVRSKKIIGERIGRNWIVNKESLVRFLDTQGNNKIDRARTLARERAQEYRVHRSFLHRTTKSLTASATVAKKSDPSGDISRPKVGSIRRVFFSQVLALSTASLILVFGGIGARASLLPQLAEHVSSIAHEAAFGFNETFSDIPVRFASRISAADDALQAHIQKVRIANARTSARIASPLLSEVDLSSLRMALDVVHPTSRVAREPIRVSAPVASITATDVQLIVRDAYALLASPAHLRDALVQTYVDTGTHAYAAIGAAYAAYDSLVQRTGAALLTSAAHTRDTLTTLPHLVARMNLAFGESIVAVSHAAIRADVAIAYWTAAAAPASARATVALIGSTGDTLAAATARVPALVATVYLRTTAVPAQLAPAIAQAVFNAEYRAAAPFVAATAAVSDEYLARIKVAGAATSVLVEQTRSLARALPDVRGGIHDVYLGMLGTSALTLEATRQISNTSGLAAIASATSALSLGEQTALTTYKTIQGIFDSARNTLAAFFTTTPPIVLPTGVPKARVTTVGTSTSPTNVRQSTSSYTSYPTYTTLVQGVSENTLVQSLATLRNEMLGTIANQIRPVAAQTVTNASTIQMVNKIEKLNGLIVTNGDFRGSIFDSGIRVSATTGSFTNLSAGTTTLANTTVSGDLTVSGTITPAIVAATSYISAPYFIATSTTATSTFAGSLNVDSGGFVYATTTRNVGIGILSPAALLAIQNSNASQPIFTVNNAAGTEVYRITNAGFVGIGTTTPFANFSLAGTVGGTTNLFAISTSTAAFATTTALTINSSGDLSLLNGANLSVSGALTQTGLATFTNGFLSNASSTITSGLFTMSGGASTTNITASGTGYFGSLGGAAISSLVANYLPKWNDGTFANSLIYDNGTNVGIGTTSPYSLLSISNSATTVTNTPLFVIASTTGGTSTSTLMTVLANGNVGISYATPTARLDIVGSSSEAVLGSEMITNSVDRDFTGSSGNWGLGVNWTYGTNNLSHTAGSGTLSLAVGFFSSAPVVEHLYQVTFTINTTSAGSVTPSFGGTLGVVVGQLVGADTETQVFAATSALTGLSFLTNAAWAGTIDDISVIEITPSNATQIVRNSDATIGLEIRSGGSTLHNSFVGTNAGKATVDGDYNAAFGEDTLRSNTTGYYNTASGYRSLYNNTTGDSNAAVGYKALLSNTYGYYNVAIGREALSANTFGDSNVASGYLSMKDNSTGYYNVALGRDALRTNTTGFSNVAIGEGAGYTGGNGEFRRSTLVGSRANFLGSGAVIDTTALGYRAGYRNNGWNSTFLGGYSGQNVTSGNNNIAIGFNALLPSATASNQLNIGNMIFGVGLAATSTSTSVIPASSGTIGIGTTSPYSVLSISNSIATTVNTPLFTIASTTAGTSTSTLMTVLANGNVGIGTSSPSAALAVSGNLLLSGTTGALLSGDGAGLTFSGTGNHDITASAGTLRIGTNTIIGNIAALDDTVDIGTPATRFDKIYANEVNATTLVGTLTGGNLTAETFTINSDYVGPDEENSYLAFERGSVSPNALLTWNAAGNMKRFEFNQPLYIENASASTTIVTLDLKSVAGQTADIFRIASSSSDTLFNVSASGRVGIGTTSPSALLSVHGNQYTSGTAFFGGALTATSTLTLSTLSTPAGTLLAVDATGMLIATSTVSVANLSLAKGNFLVGNDAGTAQATSTMFISSLGNVGIGTTSPYALLSLSNNLNTAIDTPLFAIASTTGGTATTTLFNVSASGTVSARNVWLGNTNSDTSTVLSIRNASQTTGVDQKAMNIAPRFSSAATNSVTGIDLSLLPQAAVYNTTNAYDIHIHDFVLSGGATITNQYGLYIEDLTTGSTNNYGVRLGISSGTNKYNIYADGTANSYFAGNVGIGSTTPYAKLSVKGAGSTTGVNFQTTDSNDILGLSVFDRGSIGIGVLPETSLGGISGNVVMQATSSLALTTQAGFYADIVGNTSGTANVSAFYGRALSSAASYTVTDLVGFTARGNTAGSGSTVTNSIGFRANNQTAGSNNYSFYSAQLAGATNYAFYATAAQSYFGGNVGIGTTTPTDLLHVASTLPKFYITDTDATTDNKHWFMENNAGVLSLGTTTDALAVSATRALSITNAGNVGIGTTTPDYQLVVDNNTSSADTPFLVLNNSNTSGAGGGIDFTYNYSKPNLARISTGYTADYGGRLSFWTAQTTTNTMTERMTISNIGNVGIGDTGPTTKLSVAGTVSTLAGVTDPTADLNAGASLSLNGDSTTNGNAYAIGTGALRNSKYDMWFQTGNSDGGGYRWYIGTAEKMTMNSSGNVGIGTTTPAGVLNTSVSGGSSQVFMDAYGGYSSIVLRRADGTVTSPTAVQSGEVLGYLLFRGYGTTMSATSAAYMSAVAAENFTASAQGTSLTLNTAPIGGTTAAERLRITSEGLVGIGTTTPTGLLHVASTLPKFYISDTDATADNKHWFMENNAGVLSLGTTTDALSVSPTRALSFSNVGNIGIWTTPVANTRITIAAPGAGKTILNIPAENGNNGFKIWRESANNTSLTWGGGGGGSATGIIRETTENIMNIVGKWTFSNNAGTITPLIIEGGSAQSVDLFQVASESGTNRYLTVASTGNLGVGTTSPWLALSLKSTSASGQFVASYDDNNYSTMAVDATGDLKITAKGGDIRALSENLWICDNAGCPTLTATSTAGNIFVENAVTFGNGFSMASTSNNAAAELGLYNSSGNLIVIFDKGL